MTSLKRTLAGLSAFAFTMGLTACGSSFEQPETTTAATRETTTALTVEVNTEKNSDEQQEIIDSSVSQLRDEQLDNKTIKWLATWDINPDSTGKTEPVGLSMFKSKYQGEVKWYQTTWETRYSDLSTYVLGGEGIDFFQRDSMSLPKGVVSGMFMPVDDYIDLDSELWSPMKPAMENYNFNGKHYALITDVTADNVVVYSKKTIQENGFEDPWELYQSGEWNWDTFTQMLEDFCDPDDEKWGLDGWWTENALYLSAGSPAVMSKNGDLTVNLNDPQLEKAMNWMTTLYNKGLVLSKEQFDWAEQPQYMGEGRELFYICGAWTLQAAPEAWNTKIAPEDAAMVPVPSPAGSDPYQAASGFGYCLCKGAANPLGVALFAECELLANSDDSAIEIYKDKCRNDFKWTEELIEQYYECNALARKYPVAELAAGVSSDVASLTTDGGEQVGLRAALHGYDWSTTKESIANTVQMLVDEVDTDLKSIAN
ncbi:MAG: extracellular solute-binding protein [Oscillospiraceae bacterium]|nr:extracellular solute-binding protein [Oscillospiraceae bacterium]